MIAFSAFQLLFAFLGKNRAVLGLPFTMWTMVVAALIYSYEMLYKKKLGKVMRQNLWLTAFVVQGLVWCALSYAGMANWFDLRRGFPVDLTFLPRQAFYLGILPLASVLPLSGSTQKCLSFLRRYGTVCSVGYIVCILLIRWDIRLNISDILVVGFFLLMGWSGRIWDWGAAVLALLSPLPGDGASTVVVLKILLFGMMVFKDRKWVVWLASCTLPLILVLSFVLPQLPGVWKRIPDVNTTWRLEYWQDEATAIADTRGVGVGFGTTYASKEFSEPRSIRTWDEKKHLWLSTTFSSNDEYTKEQRPFVTTSHNSFVAVTFRQGLLGLGLLLGALTIIWKMVVRETGPDRKAKMFAFCGAMFTMCFNVVFESIMYLGLIVLLLSFCNDPSNITATDQHDM